MHGRGVTVVEFNHEFVSSYPQSLTPFVGANSLQDSDRISDILYSLADVPGHMEFAKELQEDISLALVDGDAPEDVLAKGYVDRRANSLRSPNDVERHPPSSSSESDAVRTKRATMMAAGGSLSDMEGDDGEEEDDDEEVFISSSSADLDNMASPVRI